jgi:hypothetical protein
MNKEEGPLVIGLVCEAASATPAPDELESFIHEAQAIRIAGPELAEVPKSGLDFAARASLVAGPAQDG